MRNGSASMRNGSACVRNDSASKRNGSAHVQARLGTNIYVQNFSPFMSRLFNFMACYVRFFVYRLLVTQFVFLIKKGFFHALSFFVFLCPFNEILVLIGLSFSLVCLRWFAGL